MIEVSLESEPQIPLNDLTKPFWDATARRELVLQWCSLCEVAIHYPRHLCPTCGGTDLEWRESSGAGTIHAATTVHTATSPWMVDRVPYIVALVDLDDGARLLTNVVDTAGGDLVGARVRLSWRPLSGGRHLPQFTLAETADQDSAAGGSQ